MNRYHRQTLLPQIGEAGQARLGTSRVLLVGCGALGTVIAEQLVRAGIGFLKICDRDLVETTNLQRQVLFDERAGCVTDPFDTLFCRFARQVRRDGDQCAQHQKKQANPLHSLVLAQKSQQEQQEGEC